MVIQTRIRVISYECLLIYLWLLVSVCHSYLYYLCTLSIGHVLDIGYQLINSVSVHFIYLIYLSIYLYHFM